MIHETVAKKVFCFFECKTDVSSDDARIVIQVLSNSFHWRFITTTAMRKPDNISIFVLRWKFPFRYRNISKSKIIEKNCHFNGILGVEPTYCARKFCGYGPWPSHYVNFANTHLHHHCLLIFFYLHSEFVRSTLSECWYHHLLCITTRFPLTPF